MGETPLLRVPLTRDHLSAIAALTPEGRLFMHGQEHSYKGEDVVRFLRPLLRQIPGKWLIVWDGSPVQRCEAVKVFLRSGGGERIPLERLPAYAPELNPKARVWNLLTRGERKNLCGKDLAQLENALLLARARLILFQERGDVLK
jgi:transposase